jgi:predicted nucleic acid-binding protein
MIVDTNVLLAIIEAEDEKDVTGLALAKLSSTHSLYVNEIIFAEISGRYPNPTAVSADLNAFGLEFVRLSLDDCHRAGGAFRQYRQAGGTRTSILPDFLIGAQAATRGWPILTRDRKGFASYFPEVEIIDPMKVLP